MMCGVASSALGQETAATQGSADRTSQEPTKEGKTEDQATKPDDEQVRLELGVTVVADFYFNTARPIGPGVPFYLAPASLFGLNQNTFDANARATMLSARVFGPKIGDFEVSGRVQAFLFDPIVVNDKYGILPFQAFVQFESDKWLFAAGLQLQIMSPMMPNTLTWAKLGGSGNVGAGVIGQARAERSFQPSEKSQVTLTGGISEPIASTFSDDVAGREDNGWPNVEGRAALALGSPKEPGAKRPFEAGVGGVIGQIRQTSPGGDREVANVWGLTADVRWEVTPRFGLLGEAFVGQTLGVWTAGVLQNINPVTFGGIGAAGGWAEVYYYLRPDKLHTHWGYGIDDPQDEDLSPGQKARNETYFANLVLDVNQHVRFGWEATYKKTSHVGLGKNVGSGLLGHVEYKF
jgi:hypothetical protein